MALIRGLDRTATGALNTSSAAPNAAVVHQGWARTAQGLAHRHNATAALPAGFQTFKGTAYTSAGALCFTTTAPSAANSKYIHGIRHHINGAMLAKSSAPTASARVSGLHRLLYDPSDGAVFFNSVA
jgi:hypothetical protein